MGSDPASFMVNLFFYYHENGWMYKAKEKIPYSNSYLLFELILTGNMTFKIFYASLGTDILKIFRTNTEPNSFKSLCQTLISRMICQ